MERGGEKEEKEGRVDRIRIGKSGARNGLARTRLTVPFRKALG